jgi:hypothetical protein
VDIADGEESVGHGVSGPPAGGTILERFSLGLQTGLGFQPEKHGFTGTVCAQFDGKPL